MVGEGVEGLGKRLENCLRSCALENCRGVENSV